MTPSSSRSLSIVLPAFNEEDNIEGAVDDARTAAASLTSQWEIVVVDDGSADATGERADAMSRADDHVRVVRFTQNRGYGAALREGFRVARGDVIFYTDSDRQFDVGELRYFLPLMETTDLALGFRVYRYDAVLRCLLSWIYNRMVSLLFRVKVRDVDCSYKLIRREVLESIDLETTDFFIDTELVAKARKWNFRIVEKGVRHYPRQAGQSTVRASDVPRTLRTLMRIWWRLHAPVRRREPINPVCPRLHEAIPRPAEEEIRRPRAVVSSPVRRAE